MSPIIIFIFLFFIILTAISSLIVFLNAEKKRKNYQREVILSRGSDVKSGAAEGKVKVKVKKTDPNEIAKKLKAAAQSGDLANKKSLRAKIIQAGLTTPVYRFWLYSMMSGVSVVSSLYAANQSIILVVLLGFVAAFGLPRWFLKMKAGRRQKAFLHDFADALEAMVRLLKAGMPISEAIAMVSKEFTGPVGDEMTRIYEAQKVGVPLAEAVQKAGYRMPLPEMQMYATAIVIQQQTGSSLSEVLSNLANVIRSRYRLKRKIVALSSEAKASSMIIGSLPILVTGGLYAVNPEYISLLFIDPLGKTLLFGAITWMSIGVLIMRQMINFKV